MEETIIVPEGPEEKVQPDKKKMKKEISRVGGSLILYTIILNIIVAMDMIWKVAMMSFRNNGIIPEEAEILKLAESGTSSIIAVAVGILFLLVFATKRVSVSEMFRSKSRMTPGIFFRLLAVFMMAQFVFSGVAQLLEAGLNLIGFTAMDSIEAATGASSTFSMFLYASFAAPIGEELVYRGFTMEPLRKYGKLFAIVMSSVLFGVMHANLPQAMFAVCVGLVLAYTAMEYSVLWAMLLHIANNFVFAELMSRVEKLLGETGGEIFGGVVIFAFFVAGIVVLWRRRATIKEYIAKNRTEKGTYKVAFSTVTVILFIAFEMLIAFTSLKRLP